MLDISSLDQLLDNRMGILGHARYDIFDANRRLVSRAEVTNRILTRGFAWHAQRIANSTNDVITHIGAGNSASPVALTDSNLLGDQVEWKPVPAVTPGAKTVSIMVPLTTSEGNFPISEMGLRITGDVLIHRAVISTQTKTNTQTGQLIWTLTLSEPAR